MHLPLSLGIESTLFEPIGERQTKLGKDVDTRVELDNHKDILNMPYRKQNADNLLARAVIDELLTNI